jgi:hypothetical protein
MRIIFPQCLQCTTILPGRHRMLAPVLAAKYELHLRQNLILSSCVSRTLYRIPNLRAKVTYLLARTGLLLNTASRSAKSIRIRIRSLAISIISLVRLPGRPFVPLTFEVPCNLFLGRFISIPDKLFIYFEGLCFG